MCSGSSRRASSAACSRGCSVLTRPSRISGGAGELGDVGDLDARPRGAPPRCRRSRGSRPRARAGRGRSRRRRSCRRPRSAPAGPDTGAAGRAPPALHRSIAASMLIAPSLCPPARSRPTRVPGSTVTRPGGDQPDRLGEQRVLGRVDRRLERLAVAVGRDRHRALEDDRAGVDALVDEVDGDAGDPRRRARAPGRSRRGPGNDGSSAGCTLMIRFAKRRDERRREQLHVAGEHDEVDPAPVEPVGDRRVAGLAVRRSSSAGKTLGRDPGVARPARAPAPRACRSRRDDLDPVARRGAGRGSPAGWCRSPRRARRPGTRSRRLCATRSFGKRPPVERSRPASISASTSREHVVGAPVVEVAVAGQRVVAVLDASTLLRPPRRISTARVRPTAGSAARDHGEDRRRRRRRARRRRATRGAARPRRATPAARRRRRSSARRRPASARSPKWRRIAARRQRSPSTKPQTSRYWRQRWLLGLRVVDLVDEEDVQALVAVLGEQHAARGQAVAPAAPGLLVVGLERGRHRLVDHRAHVGLVDAHAERVRRDDHRRLAGHERPLRLGARLALHARVVGGHRAAPSSRASHARRLVGLLAGARRRRSPAARRARAAAPASPRCFARAEPTGTTS